MLIDSLTYGSQFLKTWCELSSGALYVPVHGSSAYGEIRWSCIAASAVTGLDAEPGGAAPRRARGPGPCRRVERDDRPAVRIPAPVAVRVAGLLDAVGERLLRRFLQAEVE